MAMLSCTHEEAGKKNKLKQSIELKEKNGTMQSYTTFTLEKLERLLT
jgi:hypothetical protein